MKYLLSYNSFVLESATEEKVAQVAKMLIDAATGAFSFWGIGTQEELLTSAIESILNASEFDQVDAFLKQNDLKYSSIKELVQGELGSGDSAFLERINKKLIEIGKNDYLAAEDTPSEKKPTASQPTLTGDFIVAGANGENIDLAQIAGKSIDGRRSISMKPGKGKGTVFGTEEMQRYSALKNDPDVYWAVASCSTGQILAKSSNAEKNIYGASVPKIVIAAAALHNNNGRPTGKVLGTVEAEWKNMINLIVISENDPAWTKTQDVAGGREGVRKFCSEMGYANMKPERPGGQINAFDMAKFYIDLVNGRFMGADAILKISNACATSNSRSKVYIPAGTPMGGKTGTWSTFNHDTGWLLWGGQFWSIVVLTDKKRTSKDVAIMWGGLFKEHIEKSLKDSIAIR